MPDKIEWISADLTPTIIDLTDGIYYATEMSIGESYPVISHIIDETPQDRGLHLKDVKTGQRDLQLLVKLKASSRSTLITKFQALAAALDPKRGDGQVRWTRSGALTSRVLHCRYISGMNQAKDKGGYFEIPLVFRAEDEPFWIGEALLDTFWPITTTGNFFPLLPMHLSHSSIFQSVSIDNNGDVETWPRWTFTGPGSDIAVYNLTTDEFFQLSVTVAAGGKVIIDTTPGKKSITDGNGNLITNSGIIQPKSSFFPLEVGVNDIRIEFSGTSGASIAAYICYQRYFTP